MLTTFQLPPCSLLRDSVRSRGALPNFFCEQDLDVSARSSDRPLTEGSLQDEKVHTGRPILAAAEMTEAEMRCRSVSRRAC